MGAAAVFPTCSGAASYKVPASKSGTIGIRLVPVRGGTHSPLSHSYIVEHLAPGTSLSRSVEVDNDTKSFADLSVYVAAANVVKGQFHFATGRTSNDLASWTSVKKDTLRLAPHTEVFDAVTLKVPHDATRGEHNAVVWAAISESPSDGKGITLVSRVGVRMYVAIGPGGSPPSEFSIGILRASRSSSGQLQLAAQIDNSGGNTLELSGHVTLSQGSDGLHAGPFSTQLGAVLAPHRSEPATVSFDSRFPQGPWHVRLTVSSGSLRHSTMTTVTFPSRTVRNTTTGNEELSVTFMAILISLVLAAALAYTLSRRRRAR
jgi:hypothetical protein